MYYPVHLHSKTQSRLPRAAARARSEGLGSLIPKHRLPLNHRSDYRRRYQRGGATARNPAQKPTRLPQCASLQFHACFSVYSTPHHMYAALSALQHVHKNTQRETRYHNRTPLRTSQALFESSLPIPRRIVDTVRRNAGAEPGSLRIGARIFYTAQHASTTSPAAGQPAIWKPPPRQSAVQDPLRGNSPVWCRTWFDALTDRRAAHLLARQDFQMPDG